MENKHWIEAPTKKQTIIFVSIGIFGCIGLLLSMTNFLTESPFRGKYFIFIFFFILTLLTTIRILKNYLKKKSV